MTSPSLLSVWPFPVHFCPQLQSKVKSLESSLGKVIKEFEEDKERWIRRSQDEAHQLQ